MIDPPMSNFNFGVIFMRYCKFNDRISSLPRPLALSVTSPLPRSLFLSILFDEFMPRSLEVAHEGAPSSVLAESFVSFS